MRLARVVQSVGPLQLSIGAEICRHCAGCCVLDGQDLSAQDAPHVQVPHASLNPRMTVLGLVGDPLRIHKIAEGRELEDRVAALLRRVGLRPEYMRRYPHAFSGGQRQRIGIARAILANPKLLIADEPTSNLDVTLQAQILELFRKLKVQSRLSMLLITHDLSIVSQLADKIAVICNGVVVEHGPKEQILRDPCHVYTKELFEAVTI